ncbi:hypothetical protein RJ641_000332 [Dillenia turbinata]|uniref:Uncharacterized protein n=1 Tax=Dillenia turbinata TaxID=194707 RepID=A0AAN8ZM98_9MAGN
MNKSEGKTNPVSRRKVCILCERSQVQGKPMKTKFLPRQNGDLSFMYDVLQAFEGNYLAQVTMLVLAAVRR